MSKRQKGKKMKRSKVWHRFSADSRFARRLVQPIDPEVDYGAAAPQPFRRNHPPKRSEAL